MEKEIKDLEEAVEKIQERLAELKEIGKAETPKRWRAEEDNFYYYLDNEGDIQTAEEFSTYSNDNRYKLGNYFKAYEEAEQKIEHIKIEQQLKDIALRLNNDKKIDWENESQQKYVLYYSFYEEEISDNWDRKEKYQGSIYCLNSNFKDIAIAEIGEERLKNYLKEC